MNKKLLIGMFLISFCLIFSSCGNSNDTAKNGDDETNRLIQTEDSINQESENESFTIIDDIKNTIEFENYPKKIMVLSPAALETIYFLGEQDRIIAVSEYTSFPEEALEKDKIYTGPETNLEQIISYSPDCIIMTKMSQTKEQAKALEEAGMSVVIIEPKTIAEVYNSIEIVGTIVGKQDESIAKVEQMKQDIERIKQETSTLSKQKTYVEISPLEFALYTGGSSTYINEMMEIVGMENIFGDVEGWAEVSQEQVIERNPQIILSTCKEYGIEDVVGEIAQRAGWDVIDAVQKNNVYEIDSSLMTTPGPRLVEAVDELFRHRLPETEIE